MKFKYINIFLVAIIALTVWNSTVSAADSGICYALTPEDRVNEIINDVYGNMVDENDYINCLEAAVCIGKIVGMDDNVVEINNIVFHDKTFYSTHPIFRWNELLNFLEPLEYNVILPKETVPNNAPEKIIDSFYYFGWVLSRCTIAQAVEMAANCIDKEHAYISVSKQYNLCDDDWYGELDNPISIGRLRELMCRLIKVNGDLYYISDMDGSEDNIINAKNKSLSYYDLYKNRLTFSIDTIQGGGKELRCLVNSNNAILICLRDYINSLGMTVDWNEGQIFTEGNEGSYIFCLDEFSQNDEIYRMFVDKSIYAQHFAETGNGDKAFDGMEKDCIYLGQYIMSDDTTYLYPKTYDRLKEYLGC